MPRMNAPLHSSVARLRNAQGFTQQQLARLAGVSRQTMVELERGDYNPSTALALRLAVLLDASVEELFQLHAEEAARLRAGKAALTDRRAPIQQLGAGRTQR